MRLIRSATQKRTETSSVDELREVNVASPLTGRCHDSLLILIAHRLSPLIQRCTRSALSRQTDAPPLPTGESPRPAPHSHGVRKKSPPFFAPSGPFANRANGQHTTGRHYEKKNIVTRARLNVESILAPNRKQTNAPIKRNQKEGHRNRRHRSIHRRPT